MNSEVYFELVANDFCVLRNVVSVARLHHSISVTGLDKKVESKVVVLMDLVFDFGLLKGKLKHELVFVVELVLEGIGEDAEYVQFACLVEAKYLLALGFVYHFHIKFSAVQHFLIDFFSYHLPSVFHLSFF